MAGDDVLFSRSGSANLFGKLTIDIGKLKVSEATHDALLRKANEAGLPLLEYVRYIVDINAHGIDKVVSLHADRMKMIAGIGKEKG